MLDTVASVAEILEKYGLSDRFDAKKVLLKMGGRRPGKRCKKGWIAAEKQCSDHKTAEGKLTAEGKQSARELASRVRDRKGMQDKNEIKIARMPLNDFIGEHKNAKTAKQLVPMMTKIHGEARSELNKRRINGGRSAIVDPAKAKKAPLSVPKAKPDLRPGPSSLKMRDLDIAYKPELDQYASQAKAHPRYKAVQKVVDRIEKAEKEKYGGSRYIDPVTALSGVYNPSDYLGYSYLDHENVVGSAGRKRPKKVKAITEKEVESFNSATLAINKKLGFEAEPSPWEIARKYSNRSDSDRTGKLTQRSQNLPTDGDRFLSAIYKAKRHFINVIEDAIQFTEPRSASTPHQQTSRVRRLNR